MTRQPVWASVAIGGTNSTVGLASLSEDRYRWITKAKLPTAGSPSQMLELLVKTLMTQQAEVGPGCELLGIGIVSGGPLDEQRGLVLGPPNLPGWDEVDAVSPFREQFAVPTRLVNDANAGVLAEWAWGAAAGASNCAFLTCGTGLGAGLIVNNQLVRGADGLAGEIGHWRLSDEGPVGYSKAGSFEGFCSGSGIGRLAQRFALDGLERGEPSLIAPTWEDLPGITAKDAGLAADRGDRGAIELWQEVGRRLGAGVALLIDLLNPEVVVLGGVYPRQQDRLEPPMRQVLEQEALAPSLRSCRVEPSGLAEEIGYWSGLAVAILGDDRTSVARLVTSATSPQQRGIQESQEPSQGTDHRRKS